MNLMDALGVRRGDVIAFVGAGGKTSAMFSLARELTALGLRVITTTTTRVAHEELQFAPFTLQMRNDGDFSTLPELVEENGHIFIFSELDEQDKVRGISPEWVDKHLAGASWVDAVLVEADGSRRLPMKAPLPHEPVIPSSATLVVPVVGLKVIGRPLNETYVYGAEVIQSTLNVTNGAKVTPELIADVIRHPLLGRKTIPAGARVVPLLNQVKPESLSDGRKIAHNLLADRAIERVVIGAVREDEPVLEVHRRVAAVILAAGQSKRMGQPKVLMPWGTGTIIRHVCQQVAACGLYEIVVVAGAHEDEIRQQTAGLPVRVVFNPRYDEDEMLSSLQTGLKAIWETSEACMVVLGDQPMIQQEIIHTLLGHYYTEMGELIAPSYQNRRGHPLLIGRKYWEELLTLPAGGAPRDVLRAHADEIHHINVETDTILRDIDTPEDYRRAVDSQT